MDSTTEPLLSVTDAALKIGMNRSTLFRQIKAGLVRSHNGKVRLSELLADRAENIDLSRSHRRSGKIDQLESEDSLAVASASDATVDATTRHDATPADDDAERAIVDGEVMSYADARALKETYLARLKGLELATKRGELAPVAAMVAYCERMFGVVRERLLAIPGKLSGELDLEQAERLTAELHEALEDLHAQGAAAEALGTARGDPDDDDGEA